MRSTDHRGLVGPFCARDCGGGVRCGGDRNNRAASLSLRAPRPNFWSLAFFAPGLATGWGSANEKLVPDERAHVPRFLPPKVDGGGMELASL